MKLVELRIKHFRTIGKGPTGEGIAIRFESNEIIFLIGVNNSGKSSVLEAYDYFVQASKQAGIDDFHGKGENPSPIEIEAAFRAENEEDRNHQAVRRWLDRDDIVRVKKTWKTHGENAVKHSWNPEENEWVAGGTGGFDQILQNALPAPVWVRGLSTPEEVVTSLQKLVKETVLQSLVDTEVYAAAQRALVKLQEQVEIDPYTAQLQTRLNETVHSIFPGVSLVIRNVGDQDLSKVFEKQTIIEAVEENRPQVGLEYHGHGVRRHFILSAYRNWADPLASTKKRGKKTEEDWQLLDDTQKADRKTKILLVEEPELFLHPAAIRAVQRLLCELADHSEFQVLCSTHAPIMICLDRPHSSLVRMVPDSQSGASAYQVDSNLFDKDERSRLRMLKEFNPHVCEAFFADRVLLVEGDTEAVVVRTMLERMRANGDLDHTKDVCVVNCGSKMNIPLFQRILRHFRISYFVFHDLDSTYSRDGRISAAWSLNSVIWEEIQKAEQESVSARRFVFERDFERAHQYRESIIDGKPYSAYKQALSWNLEDIKGKPVVAFVRAVLGERTTRHHFDQDWVEKHATKAPERQKG